MSKISNAQSLCAPRQHSRALRPFARKLVAVSAVALSVVLPSTSFATVKANNNVLNLQQAIEQTLNHNPALKVFAFKRQSLSGQQQSAALTPGYTMSVQGDNLAGSGEYSGTSQAEWSVALSSTIELGQKQQARMALASSAIDQLQAQFQSQALTTLGQVTLSYIDVLAAQERVTLAQRSNTLAQKTLKQVKARAKAGATPQAEVLRAQASASQAKLEVSSHTQRLNALNVALAAWWGSSQVNFSKVSGSLYQFGQDISFDALYEQLAQSPMLAVFSAQERVQAAQLKLAKAHSSTDLQWSLGVKQFQQGSDNALLAGLSIPLFAGSRNRGAIQTANSDLNASVAQKQAALTALHSELFQAYSQRQQAKKNATTLRQTVVPALSKALTQTRQAYKQGRYGYTEYLGARQDLIAAKSALIDAGASALRYGAQIEQLSSLPLVIRELSFTTSTGEQ